MNTKTKITVKPPRKLARRNYFQDGGVPATGAAGATGAPTGAATSPDASGANAGGDLQQMLGQYAQTRDPELAVQICDGLVTQLGLDAQGATGAPAGQPAASASGAPAAAPAGGEQTMRNGGKMYAKGGSIKIADYLKG